MLAEEEPSAVQQEASKSSSIVIVSRIKIAVIAERIEILLQVIYEFVLAIYILPVRFDVTFQREPHPLDVVCVNSQIYYAKLN